MSEKCPHCGSLLPVIVDAFCPDCRQRLDETPVEEGLRKPLKSVVSVKHRYTTFWPRFWARILDTMILAPILFLFSFTFSQLESTFLRVLDYGVVSIAVLAYSIWMHGTFGQTLGKMACRVSVLDVSEQPLTMHQAAMRDIFGIVLLPFAWAINIPRIFHGIDILKPENATPIDYLFLNLGLCWFLLECATILTNRKRRALHDFIAGSIVVRNSNASLI